MVVIFAFLCGLWITGAAQAADGSGTFAIVLTAPPDTGKGYAERYINDRGGATFTEYLCDHLQGALEERSQLKGMKCEVSPPSTPFRDPPVKAKRKPALIPTPAPGETVAIGGLDVSYVIVLQGVKARALNLGFLNQGLFGRNVPVTVKGAFLIWDNTRGDPVRAKHFTSRFQAQANKGVSMMGELWELDFAALKMLRGTGLYRRP